MKLLYTCVIACLLLACNGKVSNSQEYTIRTSMDKTYSVEIPKTATSNKCIQSFMSFMDNQSHLIIIIDKSKDTPQEYYDAQTHDDSFTVTEIENNDSLYIVKSTRGTMNVWVAYDCIGKVKVKNVDYIVSVGCDTWSMQQCKEVLSHVMSSIKNKVPDKVQNSIHKRESIYNRRTLAFGISVVTPCIMQKHQDDSYIWSGAVDPSDSNAQIYRVSITPLEISYSQMSYMEKQDIKENMLSYLADKGNYKKANSSINSILSYKTFFVQDGYKTFYQVILHDKYIIELMLFSSRKVSKKDFVKFSNSLKIS